MEILVTVFLSLFIIWFHARVVFSWLSDWNDLIWPNAKSLVKPRITVIIPCRDEGGKLPFLLDSLLLQSVAPTEILIIDDNSEDKTIEIAENHALSVRVIKNSGHGKKSAIRTGIKLSKTPWVITTDADVIVPPTWIETMCRAIQNASPKTDALVGPVKIKRTDGWAVNVIEQLDYAAMMGWAAASALNGMAAMASGANLAFRTKSYPQEHEMRPEIPSGDDVFAIHAIVESGGEVFWVHDMRACVEARGAGGIIKWVQQRARWGAKAKYYRSKEASQTAFWIAFIGVTQIVVLGAVLVSLKWHLFSELRFILIISCVLIWVGRAVVDIRFGKVIAKWFKIRAKFYDWIILSILYPFQIPLVFLLSVFRRTKWK